FDTSTDEFILQDGFTIQTIAAEPLLDSPVALSFDNSGRIWAVELPGYMRDIDGSDEEKADGRIVLLEDKNSDGIMDSRRVILDKLKAPRTLLHIYGGLLYSNGGSLFWAKLNNTLIGEAQLVDSLYVVGGNIEHQPNSLHYHLDNWIYSANCRTRYRLKNGVWLKEATSFRGQWGLSSDIDGRFYYNNNHLPVATDYAMPNQLIQNPWQKVQYGHTQDVASSREIYGYQATAVNRGYQEGVLDTDGKVRHFTSACSPLVYTGNQLGSDLFQDVFVCAPEANLIKRYIQQVRNGQITAVPAYDSSEFLISKDETFRPVNLYNAPDGSMYILDLRKGIIQHRAYMTSYLREKILERGLEAFNGKGTNIPSCHSWN
ncbi:MAG: dehydrogenase, partial [Calditrichota bacterium]